MAEEFKRWMLVAVGLLINLCLGAIYAFSVFRVPLETTFTISATQSGLPFLVFLAAFALAMPLGGTIIQKWGPMKTTMLGGILVGAGWILASFAPTIEMLAILYGLIGGSGVGIAYGCPISVSAKWFPDRAGLAIGLTVGGFGLSALITAPLIKALISSVGVMSTFLYLGIAFLILIIMLALPLRFPPEGWKPSGWTPTPKQVASAVELKRNEMIRTPTFYALWLTYTIGCLAGLMAIGIAAPFGTQVAKLSAGMAALAVSVFAIFNFAGRPLYGWLTDKLTPRYAAMITFILIVTASGALYYGGEGNLLLYFVGFCILWLNLGGWLAIAPTATKIFFGTKTYGENYGLVFTAYGAGAILGTMSSGILKDMTGTYLSVFPVVMALALMGLVIAGIALRPVKSA
ncbi:MAG: MFS transporter [Methanophagales archaeon ANME-1-THS]|nr:MAG: MFS transporter [Methanophagales archaeon ANME-1-THS]